VPGRGDVQEVERGGGQNELAVFGCCEPLDGGGADGGWVEELDAEFWAGVVMS
jgi:hypothetical protein